MIVGRDDSGRVGGHYYVVELRGKGFVGEIERHIIGPGRIGVLAAGPAIEIGGGGNEGGVVVLIFGHTHIDHREAREVAGRQIVERRGADQAVGHAAGCGHVAIGYGQLGIAQLFCSLRCV